jgi:SAM-dependent methyltransferase
MDVMRLIFHIGSPKTGTTALQTTLYNAHEALLDAGILYPQVSAKTKNHNELSLLFSDRPPAREFKQAGSTDPEIYVNHAKKIASQIIENVKNSKPEFVILSGEYFFFSLNDDQFKILNDNLLNLFDDVKIISYLRHPIDYVASRSIQIYKAAKSIQNPFSISYLDVLDSWSRHFKVEAVEFSKNNLKDGDVFADFAHRFLPENTPALLTGRFNESISAEGMCVLNAHRESAFPENEHVFVPEGQRLYRIIQSVEEEGQLHAKPVLSAPITRLIERKFAPQAAILSEKYGVNFDFKNMLQKAGAQPKPPYRVEDMFEIDPKRVLEIAGGVLGKLLSDKSLPLPPLPQTTAVSPNKANLGLNEGNQTEFCTFCGTQGRMKTVRKNTANDLACPTCNATLRFRNQGEAILAHFGMAQYFSLRAAVKAGAFDELNIYEAAIRGRFTELFKDHPNYTNSYFWENVEVGQEHDGVRCEDLTRLTFKDDSFDLAISTEVMEHVHDPKLAFREVHRVLKKGGLYAFTIPVRVPLRPTSVTRATIIDGKLNHIAEPYYHISGTQEPSLVFTDFGADIFDMLRDAGFKTSYHRSILTAKHTAQFGTFCAVKL